MRRSVLLAGPALALTMVAAGCGSSSSSAARNGSAATATTSTTSPSVNPGGTEQPAVVIGSANFTENEVLADIYADALKAKGVSVTTHLNIGSREIYFKELRSGELTVFPEYNGALLDYLNPSARASSTAAVDAALAKQLPTDLEELKPAAAQDKDSVTVTDAYAKEHHLTTIEQLKPLEKQITFGGPPEFATREEGLLGLKKLYGIVFKKFEGLDESGPLTIAALKQGKIQAGDIFTTDPVITQDHFKALADPKDLFASQNVIPIVNKKVATPLVTSTLDAISAVLTTHDLEQLVAGVELDHANISTVAEDFISQAKLG